MTIIFWMWHHYFLYLYPAPCSMTVFMCVMLARNRATSSMPSATVFFVAYRFMFRGVEPPWNTETRISGDLSMQPFFKLLLCKTSYSQISTFGSLLGNSQPHKMTSRGQQRPRILENIIIRDFSLSSPLSLSLYINGKLSGKIFNILSINESIVF